MSSTGVRQCLVQMYLGQTIICFILTPRFVKKLKFTQRKVRTSSVVMIPSTTELCVWGGVGYSIIVLWYYLCHLQTDFIRELFCAHTEIL